MSIERINQYLCLDEEEDVYFYNSPSKNWPDKGHIRFENYSSTYSECREPVLDDINLEIDENSLITVVGTNGSDFALSLFNMIKTVKGKILIDDVDITKISLQSLRKSISIFPKDASLFNGTIYFNLDPEDRYSDDKIWQVLEYVGLKDQILNLKGNLNYEIDGQKSTFSLSQKQLLCLARTILKQSKVMVIDESDCQFDLETEARLQKLYKTEFKNRTILLITKNVRHIQSSDKVLFLKDGRVQEFRSPERAFDNNKNVLNALNNKEIFDVINNNDQ